MYRRKRNLRTIATINKKLDEIVAKKLKEKNIYKKKRVVCLLNKFNPDCTCFYQKL